MSQETDAARADERAKIAAYIAGEARLLGVHARPRWIALAAAVAAGVYLEPESGLRMATLSGARLMCPTCRSAFAKRIFLGHCSESCMMEGKGK